MAHGALFKRSLGLPSATLLLIGTLVGASIFIAPGELAAEAGPAVWLSYVLAGVMAAFTAMIFAQVGSLMPVAGASYRFAAKTTSATGGFLYFLTFGVAIIIMLPVTAITIAQYLGVFFAPLNSQYSVVAIMILTCALNILGITVAKSFQNVLVIAFMSAIVLFVAGGFVEPNWENFTPLFPSGVSPVLAGVVIAYFSFIGINGVLGLSGEIINPRRNILRMILIGLGIVTVSYIMLSVALVALVHPSDLGVDAPISFAALTVFPDWVSGLFALAAVAASWTTLNGALLALPRDVYALSRSRILPASLGTLNRKNAPTYALVLITALGIGISFVSDDIARFINSSTLFVFVASIVLAIGSLRVKEKLADEYATEGFKLRGAWYYIWPVGALILTLLFLSLGVLEDPFMSLVSLGLIIGGVLLFKWRTAQLRQQGVDIDQSMDEALREEGARV